MNSSMKKCPFCHNQIPIRSEKCPKCQMILIERFQSNSTNASKSQYNSNNNITDHFTARDIKPETKKKIKLNPELVILAILMGLIILIIISYKITNNSLQKISYNNEISNDQHQEDKSNNVQEKNISSNKISDDSSNNNIPISTGSRPEINNYRIIPKKEIIEKYFANGKIFQKDKSFFNGLGQLEIKNGTSEDAVAKLVNSSIRKSVMTVYIRRNSDYNINGIYDGNYSLYFDLGRCYDEKQNIFLENNSPSKFDELLNFNTSSYNTSDGVTTNYHTFRVTLNPVLGGTARTSDVPLKEFMSY